VLTLPAAPPGQTPAPPPAPAGHVKGK
jgi:hypothetical protein